MKRKDSIMSKKETMKYIRYGVQDVLLTKEEDEKIDTKFCVAILDEDGEVVAESELYYIATEDEDGNEIEE